MHRFRPIAVLATLALVSIPLLTGCGSSFTSPVSTGSASTLGTISGKVFGGRQPIVGAHIFVLAAATAANGGVGIAASTSNKSASLLTAYSSGSFPTALDSSSSSSTYGDYYVTTDSSGSFSLTGEYTCTAGQQVYLYSSGGDTGSGSVNSVATLMAVLGTCPASGTMATLTPTVYLNEVSTVAAAYALAGFATDPLHIGDDETDSTNTSATLANTALTIATADAAQLYAIGNATNQALTVTPTGGGVVPQTTIHALANSLAACVNTSGISSTQCTNLMTYANATGDTSPSAANLATDTADAAINIAHWPANHASDIFTLAGTVVPYGPALSTAPNDWTIGITYSGNYSSPQAVAIDSSGNAWIANYGNSTITKVPASGSVTSFSGGGMSSPYGIAVDTSDNVWLSNYGIARISAFTNAGVAKSSTGYTETNLTNHARGIAIDASNNVFVTSANAVIEITASSSYASGNYYHPSGISTSWGLTPAAGNPGNIWVASEQEATELLNTSTGAAIYTSDSSTCGKNVPIAAAVDSRGYVWTVSDQYTNVYTFTTTATPAYSTTSCSTTYVTNTVGYLGGGLSTPKWIAMDGNGSAWVANSGNSSVSMFSNAGTAISGTAGYTGGGKLNAPWGLAIDASGNLWVANYSGNSVTKLIGAATPVVVPLATAAKLSKLGTRP